MRAMASLRRLLVLVSVFLAGFALSDAFRSLEPEALAIECPQAPPMPGVPGDADGDGRLAVSDPIYLLNHLFLGGPPPVPPNAAPTKTVILTRHAEREAGGDEALLTPLGEIRARQLGEILERLDPCAVIASDVVRTQLTLAPYIARLSDPPPVEEIATPAGVVERLRELPAGSTSVVCHHSNTIPAILRALELPDAASLAWSGTSHDHLLVLLLAEDAPPRWLPLSYADLCLPCE